MKSLDEHSSDLQASLVKSWGHPWSGLRIEMSKTSCAPGAQWECWPLGRGKQSFRSLEEMDKDIVLRQEARECFRRIMEQEDGEIVTVSVAKTPRADGGSLDE
jgi:hypothetical protein